MSPRTRFLHSSSAPADMLTTTPLAFDPTAMDLATSTAETFSPHSFRDDQQLFADLWDWPACESPRQSPDVVPEEFQKGSICSETKIEALSPREPKTDKGLKRRCPITIQFELGVIKRNKRDDAGTPPKGDVLKGPAINCRKKLQPKAVLEVKSRPEPQSIKEIEKRIREGERDKMKKKLQKLDRGNRKRGVCPVCNSEKMIQDLNRKKPQSKMHKCFKNGDDLIRSLVHHVAFLQRRLGPIKDLGKKLCKLREDKQALKAFVDRLSDRKNSSHWSLRDLLREIRMAERRDSIPPRAQPSENCDQDANRPSASAKHQSEMWDGLPPGQWKKLRRFLGDAKTTKPREADVNIESLRMRAEECRTPKTDGHFDSI